MRKIVSAILCLCLILSVFSGCTVNDAASDGGKLNIVTTIFPMYDWVREIAGENAANVSITMLFDNGADLHSYQPTADDIIRISDCDMLIYVGGESDGWIDDALKENANGDKTVINLIEALGSSAKEEETVEGMETERGEGGERRSDPEIDEHVWLSLKNAVTLCGVIADGLSQLDPGHADVYRSNYSAYADKLAALDGEYSSAVDASERTTLIFGDRFPFRYLADDYGLDYYAAFAGCSAETEASFETISFLSGKAAELDVPCVLAIDGSDCRIADTVISNAKDTDKKVLIMDSMQSVTSEDVQNGASYLSIMERNLDILKEALK